MVYSVWVQTDRNTMKRVRGSWNSRQAGRQWAKTNGKVAFIVRRDPDALPIKPPKRARKQGK